MSSPIWNPAPIPFRKADDTPAASALAFFFDSGTDTPMVTFLDSQRSIPHTHPVVANGAGIFSPIYLTPGDDYKVRVEEALGAILFEADGIANPAENTGEGLVVTSDQISMTGDVIWNAASGVRSGWVRANGQTIGSSGSGAVERANDDCAALFAFLWNNFPNASCPVSTGRGANPEADFAAGKTLGVLNMRGRGMVGADTMGAVALNLIQKTTTITTTNASAASTVASAVGLCVGMAIVSTNVPAGTTITNIIGTAVTLSANATATASGTAARFSIFADAQVGGSIGGENTHTPLDIEVGAHIHTASAVSTVTDPTHFHNVTTDADTSNLLVGRETAGTGSATYDLTSGASNDAISVTALAAAKATGVTVGTTVSVASSGSGVPSNQWHPSMVGTYYLKL